MLLLRLRSPSFWLLFLASIGTYQWIRRRDEHGNSSSDAGSGHGLRRLGNRENNTVYCRPAKRPPHQTSTWQERFPSDLDDLPVGLCEGTIEIKSDGHMCAKGKVSFGQLQHASGYDRPIYQLSADTVSINGHMTSGSGYVWLGPEVFYGYDFISSYTVDGVEYTADNRMTDKLLAASRGTIDGVCFIPEFRQYERYYTISHRTERTTSNPLNEDLVKESSYTFVSRFFTVYEFHEWSDQQGGLLDPGVVTFTLNNFLTGLATFLTNPDIASGGGGIFAFVPTNVLAPLARLVVSGTVSTAEFPVPVQAPDDITEAIQIDTEYRTLLRALRDGLFTSKPIPLFYYIRFKKVKPFAPSNSCWQEPTVVLEITGPQGDGAALDAWVDEVVTPALLQAGGTIGLHFGKRIPPNSKTTREALDKYASCGAKLKLDLSPKNCFHPQCTRTPFPQQFTYPPEYYAFDP